MAEIGSGREPAAGQLPLEVRLRDEATLDNFLPLPAVQPVLAALREQPSPGGEPALYLHGPRGSGKSHLLQASCQAVGSGTLYLPLAMLRHCEPDQVLQGVEALERICLDDLQAIAGDPGWELALFDLCNRAREGGCRLVFAATESPRALRVGLPDLRSRLAWGVVFRLPEGDDEDKAAILRFRAARRGLALAPEVAAYIVSHAARDIGNLLAVLDRLDEASLAQKRALSIPFVKSALGW